MGFDSTCYVGQITISANDLSSDVIEINDYSNVMVYIMEDAAFSAEIFQEVCDWLGGISESVDKQTDSQAERVGFGEHIY